MARLDKPQGPRPTIYSRDAVRGWLKQIDAVVDFDFDAYLEARPELCDGIPADHNLNDDHEL